MEKESLSVAGNVENFEAETIDDASSLDDKSDPPTTHKISVKEKLKELRERAEHLKDQLYRAIADRDNMQRIMKKSVDDTRDYATTEFARDIVSSLDNLWRVLEDGALTPTQKEGISITCREIESVLKRHGVDKVDPIDQLFDYNFHQSVSEVIDNQKEAGTVVKVLQCGYTIKKRLLRPAMVVVSKVES